MTNPISINVILPPELAARLEADLGARITRGERATRSSIVRELLDEHLPAAPLPADPRQERLPGT